MEQTKPPGKRILIVDDTDDIRTVLVRRLMSWGYEPLEASTGEEGLEMVYKHMPDLVLLDIMMPKMKGRDVCAKVKADPKTKDIPIIFLTALGLADHVKAGMELGAEDYIVKPFEPVELRERIEVCLIRHDEMLRERNKGDVDSSS